MRRIGLKIGILAIVASTISAWAGDGEAPGVRNCTWCHGTSGQGYTVAPRLAGQRPQYIESQIRSFHEHTRDNPFSKQYMWGAVAALGPREARDLAIYFASITPKAASDGDRNLVARGRTIYLDGIPEANIGSLPDRAAKAVVSPASSARFEAPPHSCRPKSQRTEACSGNARQCREACRECLLPSRLRPQP